MKYLALALALVCACDDGDVDNDDVKATKAQCHDLLKHVVVVSPQAAGQDAEAVASALPIEDIQSCVASEPEIRACMLAAPDLAGVKKCIPSNEKLDCMQTAAKAKKAAHEKANTESWASEKDPDPDSVMDKPFDDIRARCWAGDVKAAEILNKETI
ncbi:MAG TPA: hypothetical protein VF403_09800 [Kofleriaceae bacterium]